MNTDARKIETDPRLSKLLRDDALRDLRAAQDALNAADSAYREATERWTSVICKHEPRPFGPYCTLHPGHDGDHANLLGDSW